jgi:type IV pilus assembly protein PilM
MSIFNFGKKKVLGLDIGTSSIKLAEMDFSARGASLEAFGFVQTPPNAVSAGELNDPASLSITLQSLLSELKTKRKHICTGMWGTAVIVKRITIPKSDAKMIGEQLNFYAEQYIPFDINNVSLSFHLLSNSTSPDTVDVLLVAAQNELVSQYNQVVVSAGLTCSILDVSGFALANCFEANYGKLRGETVAVINFGSSVSNFVVINGGEIIFCRDIPVGGLNYTNEISKTMGVTVQEAESLKLSAIARREVPDDVHSVITNTNEMISEEIRNSLDFLNATSGNTNLSRLFYTGGSATTTGLVDTVQKSIGLITEVFNPFQRVRFNSRRLSQTYMAQISPFASVAMGLGLRTPGDG